MILKNNLVKVLTLVALVLLVTYATVRPSLDFSLYGDDWIVLWGMRYNSGPGTGFDYTTFAGYFGPYTIPHYTTALINHFWGYNSQVYFVFTYICRVLAALGLSFFAYTVTKSYKAALVTGLLYGVITAGLETTNWGPFNMPTYVAIFFLSLALSLLVVYLEKKRITLFLISLIFLVLSIMMFPQRMHGAAFLYLGVDMLFFFTNSSRKKALSWIKRLAIVIGIFIVLLKLNTFGGAGDREWISNQIVTDLSKAKPYFWSSIITSVGNLLIPNLYWDFSQPSEIIRSLLGDSVLTPRIKPIFFLFGLSALILSFRLSRKRGLFLAISLILGFFWSLYVKSFLRDLDNNFHSVPVITNTLIGGYFYSLIIGYILTLKRKDKIFVPIVTVAFLPLVMLFASWARSSFQPLDTTFRYITIAGMTMPLLAGLLISRAKGKFAVISSAILIVVVGLIHFSVSQSYLNNLLVYRNRNVYDRLWEQFAENTKNYKPQEEFAIFYFEGDPGLIYNVFVFGLPPKLALMYDIGPEKSLYLPVFLDRFDELKNVVSGGDHIKAFGKAPEKISSDRIYAFRVTVDKLLDIRPEIVQRLKSEIKNYK